MAELTLEQQKAIALAKARVRAKAPKTGIVEQGMSGVNEGIANFLGFPVDAMTGAVNLGVSGINKLAGTDIAQIENPVGGTGTFNRLLAPTISDVAPQTAGQRYARRIGQEVGFGAPAAMTGAAIPRLGAAARANMPAYLAASASGDIGAGVSGQTTQELLPENKIAQIAATLLGGVGGAGAVSMMMPGLKSISLDDAKTAEAAKWKAVQGADAPLAPGVSDDLVAALGDRLVKERATNPNLFPRANATVEDIANLPPKSIYEIEEARRLAGRNVAGNADEAKVGVGMKEEISAFLDSLTPNKVQGADPEGIVADLKSARGMTARVKRAEAVLNKEMRAERRAATSGTGGNEVNAKRQNIGALLDIERDPTLSGRRQGFTPDEVALMDKIAFGSKPQNAARTLGRMAPNSGALPLMATGWGGAAGLGMAAATGNPIAAIPAGAGAIGLIAKTLAEKSTNKDIERLMQLILSGAPQAPSSAQKAAKAAIVQQLLSQSAGGPQ